MGRPTQLKVGTRLMSVGCANRRMLEDKAIDSTPRRHTYALCWRQSCCALVTSCGSDAQKVNAQQVACQ